MFLITLKLYYHKICGKIWKKIFIYKSFYTNMNIFSEGNTFENNLFSILRILYFAWQHMSIFTLKLDFLTHFSPILNNWLNKKLFASHGRMFIRTTKVLLRLQVQGMESFPFLIRYVFIFYASIQKFIYACLCNVDVSLSI